MPEVKQIARLALPVVSSQLAFMAINVTDVVMAGRFSSKDLAGVAVGTSIVMPVYLVCMGIIMSINPIVAHLFGANRFNEIGGKLHQCFWMALILSVPSIFILFNCRPILDMMGVDQGIADLAAAYMRAIGKGIPFAYFFMCVRFFNEGLSHVKPTTFIMLIAVALNGLGNYTLMYGHFGFPAMGAVGCGYASAIDMVFLFSALALWTKLNLGEKYKLFRFEKPKWEDLKELAVIGFPNGASLGLEITLFSMVALFVATMGEAIVGAHQIALNIASVTFMLPLGVSMALGIRIGQAAGRGDMHGVWHTGKAGFFLTVAMQALTALVMAVFAGTIVGWYTSETEVASLAVSLVLYAAIFQISDGIQVVSSGALRGLKDTRLPMVSNLIAYWGVGLPIGYWLGMGAGMSAKGFWLGLVSGLSLAAVLHLARFVFLVRRAKNQIPV